MIFNIMFLLEVIYHTPDDNLGRVMLALFVSTAFGAALRLYDKFSIYFMGLTGGLLLGVYFSEIISGMTGWTSFYMMSYVSGVFMVLCVTAASGCVECSEIDKSPLVWMLVHCCDSECKGRIHARTYRLGVTSLVGSYCFMRGWACFIGGFPTEK